MKCDVEGCLEDGSHTLGSDNSHHLCAAHREAWGYFHRGYSCAYGRQNNRRLSRKFWDRAMADFLEWCRIEIVGCTIIAEAAIERGLISTNRPSV